MCRVPTVPPSRGWGLLGTCQPLPLGGWAQGALTLLKALFTCSTASLLFSQGRKRCCGGKEKV